MRPTLSLVIDRAVAPPQLPVVIAAAAAAGVDWIQIRERALESAELLRFAAEIVAAARSGSQQPRILVNKRSDVALALAADGVHLGFDAIAIPEARRLLGTQALIGISAHSPEEVRAAEAAGAGYAHLAPLFDPISKRASRPALGLAAIEEAARYGLPVLAQGGIEPAHCTGLIRAGAAGVAVTGAILMAEDPAAATAQFRAALDTA